MFVYVWVFFYCYWYFSRKLLLWWVKSFLNIFCSTLPEGSFIEEPSKLDEMSGSMMDKSALNETLSEDYESGIGHLIYDIILHFLYASQLVSSHSVRNQTVVLREHNFVVSSVWGHPQLTVFGHNLLTYLKKKKSICSWRVH